MEDFFDEIGSELLLVLFLMTLTKEENDTVDEKLEDKLEDKLEASVPEPALQEEPVCYIFKSRNRKRLRPKAVYF